MFGLVYLRNGKKLESYVMGRRNWVIKTYDNRAIFGSWGVAKRNGQLRSVTFQDMADHKIHWLEYTYKKDALTALKELENIGYKIVVLSK